MLESRQLSKVTLIRLAAWNCDLLCHVGHVDDFEWIFTRLWVS